MKQTDKNRRVTIKDIAREAGVTPATVSYILNDKPFAFKEETVQRVKKIAEQMRYSANSLAQALVTGKTNTVAIVFIGNSEAPFAVPFMAGLVTSLCDELGRNGFNIFFSSNYRHKNKDDFQKHMDEVFNTGKFDGVIIIGPVNRENGEWIKEIDYRTPFVLMGKIPDCSNINMVDIDNIEVGSVAVNHLLSCGRKRIGIIATESEYSFTIDRIKGAEMALRDNDIVFDDDFLEVSGSNIEESTTAAVNLIKRIKGLDAIYITSCLNIFGVIRAAEDLGLRIPEDIALITEEESSIIALSPIPLTTISVDTRKIGSSAAKMIVEKINRKEKRSYSQVYVEPAVIKRQST